MLITIGVRNSIAFARMRHVYVGNFDYDTRHSDLERLFSKFGRVKRVDMKSGKTFSCTCTPYGDQSAVL
ncbi:putative RNA recognition motif domain, nucleotide-binding alpha-beta plait domain superfamily [Arabidopsis thaliana]|jgi:RNA recognition motif-containing protein